MEPSADDGFFFRRWINERPEYQNTELPSGAEEQRQLLRGLMNLRAPQETDAEFFAHCQDEYLQTENRGKGHNRSKRPDARSARAVSLAGGHTTLKCDAIVNAAKQRDDRLLYPEPPLYRQRHHTYAGGGAACLLRGNDAPPGPSGAWAGKDYPAFNLPCRCLHNRRAGLSLGGEKRG